MSRYGKTSSSSSSGGMGVLGALGILFVGLKLAGVIDWSWWWVTCPFWIVPFVILIGLVVWLIVRLTTRP